VRTVEITSEPVELYKILKFEGLAASGGEAKQAIADGYVRVNGQVETRKRKKIMTGDIIEFDGDFILIKLTAIHAAPAEE
jgi:ribosome-associated protein